MITLPRYLAVCLLVTACSSVRYGQPFVAPGAPPPDTAMLHMASQVRDLALFLDGTPAAEFSASDQYIRLVLEPGVHSLEIGASTAQLPVPQTRYVFRALGGKNYYGLVTPRGIRLLERGQGLFYLEGTALVEH